MTAKTAAGNIWKAESRQRIALAAGFPRPLPEIHSAAGRADGLMIIPPHPFDIARREIAAERQQRFLLPAGIVIVGRRARGEQAADFAEVDIACEDLGE